MSNYKPSLRELLEAQRRATDMVIADKARILEMSDAVIKNLEKEIQALKGQEMKSQVDIWGWCVVDSANWSGAHEKHGVIARVADIYPTREGAEGHLRMLRCMPEFLHKDWIVVNVGVTFFEVEGAQEGGRE